MTEISMLDVEGCSPADPLETEEDWEDLVGSQLRYWLSEHKFHDRNGWYAELAGSEKCLALGTSGTPKVTTTNTSTSITSADGAESGSARTPGTAPPALSARGECHLGDWPAEDILWAAVRA